MKKTIAIATLAALGLILLPAAASAQLYVKNGGNAGIGDFETTNPIQPLHIKKPGQVTFQFESTTLSSKFNFKIDSLGRFALSKVGTPAEMIINAVGSPWVLKVGGPIEATAFNIASSRTFKEGFEALSPADVLDKVSEMPISRWRYKDDPRATTHIGPMAEDFYAAFETGTGDQSISLTDASGVALAAIQGLHEQSRQKDQLIADLLSRIEKLEQRLDGR